MDTRALAKTIDHVGVTRLGTSTEAVVVMAPSRDEAAERLPADWIEPVVAHYGQREMASA